MNCENCSREHDGSYGSGRFCSCKCARGFSSKAKREEINEKVRKKLKGRLPWNTGLRTREIPEQVRHEPVKIICSNCKIEFERPWNRRFRKFCSISCATKNRWQSKEYREFQVSSNRERCKDPKERERLRDIGRKGGFGKKGYTEGGTRFESMLEKQCFEHLEEHDIEFVAHPRIPNSSKVGDVFLPKKNLWIEIDGIDREKRKKWLKENYNYWIEKLEIYKREQLSVVVVKSFDDFKLHL